jgi:CRP/FNR family transcriptional regulator, cyclic AMP receptor protein
VLSCVNQRERERLASRATLIGYREGETVVIEGQGGAGFYVILAGCASVSVDGHLRRALGRGDSFGELSLLGRRPRSATVVAATDLHCAVFPLWEFRSFVAEHPCVASSLRRQMVPYLAPPSD